MRDGIGRHEDAACAQARQGEAGRGRDAQRDAQDGCLPPVQAQPPEDRRAVLGQARRDRVVEETEQHERKGDEELHRGSSLTGQSVRRVIRTADSGASGQDVPGPFGTIHPLIWAALPVSQEQSRRYGRRVSVVGELQGTIDQVARLSLDRSWRWRYALAVGAVVVAYLTRMSLADGLGDRSPFQTFVLAALVSAVAGGFGPGCVTTLLGGVLVAYTHLAPANALAVGAAGDALGLGLYVTEGILAAVAGEALRRALSREEDLRRDRGRVPSSPRGGGTVQASSEPPVFVEPLTERELEILRLVASGLRNNEIAARCFVSQSTVKTHLVHVYAKLGVHTRTEAVARCLELNLFERGRDDADVSAGESRGRALDPA